MQKLIVDGYNVIHADPRMKKTTARDLERARDQLIERIRKYMRGKQIRVTVVFDGRGGLTDVETVVPGKLQVLYSSQPQSADELILKTLNESPNPQEYIVVTSDMADIGGSARGMGAKILSSRAFLERIARGSETAKPRTQKAAEEENDMNENEVDYWLDQFKAGGKGGCGKSGGEGN